MSKVAVLDDWRTPRERTCAHCGGSWFNVELAQGTPGSILLDDELNVVGIAGELVCRECGWGVEG